VIVNPATICRAFREERGQVVSQVLQDHRRYPWLTTKISQKFVGEYKFGLQPCDQDENITGYHPSCLQVFRKVFI